MALQGPGIYRFNSIFNPNRCIDLNAQDSVTCQKMPQNNSGQQLWRLYKKDGSNLWTIVFTRPTVGPEEFGTWNSEINGSTIFLIGAFQALVLAAGNTTEWDIQEQHPNQYSISCDDGIVDYFSDDGDSGPIHIKQNATIFPQQLWGLEFVSS